MADERGKWVREGDGWRFAPARGGVWFFAWREADLFGPGEHAVGFESVETDKGAMRSWLAVDEWRAFAALPALDVSPGTEPGRSPAALACPLCGKAGGLDLRTDGERYDCGACGGTVRARVVAEYGTNATADLRRRVGLALGRTEAEALALTPDELVARVEALAKDRDRLHGERDDFERRFDALMPYYDFAVALAKEVGTVQSGAGIGCTWEVSCLRTTGDAVRSLKAEATAVREALALSADAPLDAVLANLKALSALAKAGDLAREERDAVARERDRVREAFGAHLAGDERLALDGPGAPTDLDGLAAAGDRLGEINRRMADHADRVMAELRSDVARAMGLLAAGKKAEPMRILGRVVGTAGECLADPMTGEAPDDPGPDGHLRERLKDVEARLAELEATALRTPKGPPRPDLRRELFVGAFGACVARALAAGRVGLPDGVTQQSEAAEMAKAFAEAGVVALDGPEGLYVYANAGRRDASPDKAPADFDAWRASLPRAKPAPAIPDGVPPDPVDAYNSGYQQGVADGLKAAGPEAVAPEADVVRRDVSPQKEADELHFVFENALGEAIDRGDPEPQSSAPSAVAAHARGEVAAEVERIAGILKDAEDYRRLDCPSKAADATARAGVAIHDLVGRLRGDAPAEGDGCDERGRATAALARGRVAARILAAWRRVGDVRLGQFLAWALDLRVKDLRARGRTDVMLTTADLFHVEDRALAELCERAAAPKEVSDGQ